MAVVQPLASRPQRASQPGPLAHGLAANDPAIGAVADALVPTVFHEHWWLDTVTRRQWQAAEVLFGGKLVGWMPYVLSKRRGFTVSVMPMLAHLLGPAVDTGADGSKTAWLRRFGVVRELVARLPKVSHFSQTCHPDTVDVLALQACGFESFVQFTAEIAPHDERLAWAGLRDKVRNVIRRAQEEYTVEVLADPHEFARAYERNLRAAGGRAYFDTSLIAPLYEAAAARGQARLVGARAKDGELAAAVFYACDRRRLWYFLSTRDARRAGNGAVPLLVWEGLRMAAERRLVFDFDGVASEGAGRFYAGFGASFRPRFAVWRRSVPYALFTSAVDALRGRPNRNPFVAP